MVKPPPGFTNIKLGYFTFMEDPRHPGKWIEALEPLSWHPELIMPKIILRTRRRPYTPPANSWKLRGGFQDHLFRTFIVDDSGEEIPCSNLHRTVEDAKLEAKGNLRNPAFIRALATKGTFKRWPPLPQRKARKRRRGHLRA